MKKFVNLIICILIIFSLVGCETLGISNKIVIEPSKVKDIALFGQWQCEDQKKDNFIFTNDIAKIREEIVYTPKYKLKKVDTLMYLSEKYREVLKEILGSVPNNIDIISVYDDKNVYCDYIKINDKSGLIVLNNEFIKVEKKKSVETIIPQDIKKAGSESENNSYYNMPCGVLLGLKSKEGTYRTLWITFSNNSINKVYEIQDIIVPRRKGLWKININNIIGSKNKLLTAQNINLDSDLDAKKTKDNKVEISEINFISDSYVGVKVKDDNNIEEFRVLPLDNVKNKYGLKLSEILGVNYLNVFENAFKLQLNMAEQVEKDKFKAVNIKETNYTMNRANGHWSIIGRVNSKDNAKEYFDFNINKSKQDKIINFDELYIHWSKAKDTNPWVRDMVNSPNKRLSCMVAKNKLFICEIKNGEFKTDVSKTINVSEDDTVIMAEWATRDFVSKWNDIILKEQYKVY